MTGVIVNQLDLDGSSEFVYYLLLLLNPSRYPVAHQSTVVILQYNVKQKGSILHVGINFLIKLVYVSSKSSAKLSQL